jgi:hypothetical protein
LEVKEISLSVEHHAERANGMAGGGHSRIFANPANKAGNGFQPFHTPFSLLAVQPLPLALQLINSFFHGFSPII